MSHLLIFEQTFNKKQLFIILMSNSDGKIVKFAEALRLRLFTSTSIPWWIPWIIFYDWSLMSLRFSYPQNSKQLHLAKRYQPNRLIFLPRLFQFLPTWNRCVWFLRVNSCTFLRWDSNILSLQLMFLIFFFNLIDVFI